VTEKQKKNLVTSRPSAILGNSSGWNLHVKEKKKEESENSTEKKNKRKCRSLEAKR
jgi:hypothetical protein